MTTHLPHSSLLINLMPFNYRYLLYTVMLQVNVTAKTTKESVAKKLKSRLIS